MMVERRWPTCISLARFGADRSMTTRCCGPFLRTPRWSSARAASRRWARAWLFWKKLRKPGPAISTLATCSSRGRASMSFSARSRGFMPAGLASIMAMLLAKSPWLLSLVFSTWMAGLSPSGSTPSLARRVRACWISWRMVSFIFCSSGRPGEGWRWLKTVHYRRAAAAASSFKRRAARDFPGYRPGGGAQNRSIGSTSSDQRTARPPGNCSSAWLQGVSRRCRGARALACNRSCAR
ncbi:hypothetical protein D9M68_585710 [compost metagenome]